MAKHRTFKTAYLIHWKFRKAKPQLHSLLHRVANSLKTFRLLNNRIVHSKHSSNKRETRPMQKLHQMYHPALLELSLLFQMRLYRLLRHPITLHNKLQLQHQPLLLPPIKLRHRNLLRRKKCKQTTRISLSWARSQGLFPRPRHTTQIQTFQ